MRREHRGGDHLARRRRLHAEEVVAGGAALRRLLRELRVEREQVLAEERVHLRRHALRQRIDARPDEEAVGLEERPHRERRHLVRRHARADRLERREQLGEPQVRRVEVMMRMAVEREHERALGVDVAARPEDAIHLGRGDEGVAEVLEDGEREREVEGARAERQRVRIGDDVDVRRQRHVDADQVRPIHRHVPRADLDDDGVGGKRLEHEAGDPLVVAVSVGQRRIARQGLAPGGQEDRDAVDDRVAMLAAGAVEAVAAPDDRLAAGRTGEEVVEARERRSHRAASARAPLASRSGASIRSTSLARASRPR